MSSPTDRTALTARAAGAARGVPVAARPGVLLAGFGVALGVRVWAGQPQVSQSAPAGLLFAAVLVVLTVASGVRLPVSWHALGIGLVGGLVLCLPVVARGDLGTHRPAGSFAGWALVVALVAVAEEVFLRGALFAAGARQGTRRGGPSVSPPSRSGCCTFRSMAGGPCRSTSRSASGSVSCGR